MSKTPDKKRQKSIREVSEEMKKLHSEASMWQITGTINDLIDRIEALNKVITRDIVRITTDEIIEELSDEYYREVTLHIHRDKTIAEAILESLGFNPQSYFLPTDANLQKALDEVKGESNE